MKIYTRTGDNGETGLVGGKRIAKDTDRICVVGEIDELNACIGLARAYGVGLAIEQSLADIQNWIFDLGAELATPEGSRFVNQALSQDQIDFLERSMDEQNETLPPLRHFILPGGSLLAGHLHLARCVCRRAERQLLRLSRTEPVRGEALRFLNRLSDWLFVAARTANSAANVEDIIWVGKDR